MVHPPPAEIIDGCKTFIPLENNPDVLKTLCNNLRVAPGLQFIDIVSLSPDDLRQYSTTPCRALIVLAETAIFSHARPTKGLPIPEYQGSGPEEPVLWMKQTINHACGLMALLHVLFNVHDSRYVVPGTPLEELRQQAVALGPDARARLLYESAFLEKAHMDAASRGSSRVPSPREDNQHHFMAFVQKDSRVWELNGGLPGPFLRGTIEMREGLLSEKGLRLTVQEFLAAAEQTGHSEMSIVAVIEDADAA
ncbi:Ubiquitin carboxyl-terminal hydrolase [Penicillium ucsense]|uniref:Ubiquitin carboxyl-terminal hydrolase n=1 Tax=Penicillium ucsense TaxID=2839758 RepID=A0A8J8W219_9EURO|nr:Ubiquitin carboxyl-terminal hydrolase [Penicillium ucsense]KAF7735974.1 Ubiquitin carboxyl-terminal hydrolase [Penicillium ucsense]